MKQEKVLSDIAELVDGFLKFSKENNIFSEPVSIGGRPQFYEIRSRCREGFEDVKLFNFYYVDGSSAEVMVDLASRSLIYAEISRTHDRSTDILCVNTHGEVTSVISLDNK